MIDLSIYRPGAHPAGSGDEHCCDAHEGTESGRYEHENDLFVSDGQHVVFLYWSEAPNEGVHTGWGGTDSWACRCGWRNTDNDLFKKPFPDQPPYGAAGSDERRRFIEWQDETYTWWAPRGFDFYAMHAWDTRAIVIPPGSGRKTAKR